MALFARIVWRGAVDSGSHIQFIALVEIVKKKGGTPVCFVLGRHTMSCDEPEKGKNEMIRIKTKLIGKYIKRFWPQGMKEGSAFFDCESGLWQKTNPWLYIVVVESWYNYAQEKYVRVYKPRKKRKKPFRTEEEKKQASLIQEARVREALYLRELRNELSNLRLRLESLEEYDVVPGHVFVKKENSAEYGFICRKLEKLRRAIECAAWERPKIALEFLKPIPRIAGSLRLVSSSR